MRDLIVILGDQLSHHSPVFEDLDPSVDAVWMAEVEEEATHVWCHKIRITLSFRLCGTPAMSWRNGVCLSCTTH